MQRYIAFAAFLCNLVPTHAQPTQFEVASIRRTNPDARTTRNTYSEGRLTAENVTLRMLIENAFGLKPFQLMGGPKWMDSDRFTLLAQADPSTTSAQARAMVQALLKERFHLAMHSEIQEQARYVLQVKDKEKAKLKLRPAQEDTRQGLLVSSGGKADPSTVYKFQKYTMALLADMLSRETQRLVIDETEIRGAFDFELNAIREPEEHNVFIAQLAPIISDLGLRLISEKGPVEFFIVDRADPPSEN